MTGLLALGLGYSAAELGRGLLAEGWPVRGTARDAARRAALRAAGFEAQPFPGDAAAAGALLAGMSHVLVTAAPGEAGDPVLAAFAEALRRAAARPGWLGYLSTTAVYGDLGGGWADEDTAPAPGSERGRRRLAAERAWQRLGEELGIAVHVFRLPGIYGPGRSALDAVRAGRALRIDKPGQVFCRIHVADIAATLRASMAAPRAGAVYNVVDDLPAAQHEIVAYACTLLGAPVPPLIPYEAAAERLSPMGRGFYGESRRVRNARIKRELGVTLRHPDYRAGLRAILAAEAASPATR